MRALSQSQKEILSLMGVEVWRHRQLHSPPQPPAGDSASWSVAAQPELPAQAVIVCECESPNVGLDPAARRLLDNILYAAGLDHASCLQLLSISTEENSGDDLLRILDDALVRDGAPLLIFGARVGALIDGTPMQQAPVSLSPVLPALSTMLVEPQAKRLCWNRLREMMARSNA